MNIVRTILYYSMINNLVISIIKIMGGSIFGLSTLFADGIQTLSDFITDIVCLVCDHISKKRPNKEHPFGFGKVEYLANLFVSFVLIVLAILLFFSSFNQEPVVPSLSVLWLLLIVFLLKILAIHSMFIVGKKRNSQLLITSVKESLVDVYSTIGVAVVTVLLQFIDKFHFLKYSDFLGTILISFLVFKTALNILIENSMSIIGEVDSDEENINKVNSVLSQFNDIEDTDIKLIKYGSYYKLQLEIKLKSNLTVRKITNLETKIKKTIKSHKSLKIKYISIYIEDKKKTSKK